MDRRSISVLGGGLNNMLMSLAQLLTESCERDAVLLLPPFDADPLARERDWHPNRTYSGGERTWHSSVPRYCVWLRDDDVADRLKHAYLLLRA